MRNNKVANMHPISRAYELSFSRPVKVLLFQWSPTIKAKMDLRKIMDLAHIEPVVSQDLPLLEIDVFDSGSSSMFRIDSDCLYQIMLRFIQLLITIVV
jgi:hypothetical protein